MNTKSMLLLASALLMPAGQALAEPYWSAASHGTYGPDPVYVHTVGEPEWVCRVNSGGGIIPGILSVPNGFCTYIDWGGHRSYTYEILQDPGHELEWRDKNDFDPTQDRPFVGGWKANVPIMYICRPNHLRNGFRYSGVLEGTAHNGVCFIPDYDGRQDQTYDYEVLVYKR